MIRHATSHIDQLGGLLGWRWLFLLEGLPAVLLSFAAFWLPDYMETTKFLTEEERLYLKDRLASGAPKGEQHWDWKSLRVLIEDPTLCTFALYWTCHGIGGGGWLELGSRCQPSSISLDTQTQRTHS